MCVNGRCVWGWSGREWDQREIGGRKLPLSGLEVDGKRLTRR